MKSKLILLVLCTQSTLLMSDIKSFAKKATSKDNLVIAAGMLTALFIGKQLLVWSHNKLMDKARNNYKRATKYLKLVDLIDNKDRSKEEKCEELRIVSKKSNALLSNLDSIIFRLTLSKYVTGDEKLLRDLSNLQSRLELLRQFIKKNKCYIELHNLKDRLNKFYKEELGILVNSDSISRQEIVRFARSKYAEHKQPLKEFVSVISEEIQKLNNLTNIINPDLVIAREAKELKNNLVFIRNFILGDKDYAENKDKKIKVRFKEDNMINNIIDYIRG